MERTWVRPLLWQIWRLGGIGESELALTRFLKSHRLSTNDLDVLETQGLVESGIRGHEVSYELTESGLDQVLEVETPLWQERLQNVVYTVTVSEKLALAQRMREEKIPYELITNIVSRDSYTMLEEHEFRVTQAERVNKELSKFLEGKLPLKELTILSVFHNNPALTKALQGANIHTLVKLLSHRASDLTKKRGLGSLHTLRIKERLSSFSEYLEA